MLKLIVTKKFLNKKILNVFLKLIMVQNFNLKIRSLSRTFCIIKKFLISKVISHGFQIFAQKTFTH